jgi:hypothetical protein
MSVHRDFFEELIHRVTALEQQLASLRVWMKLDRGPDIGENVESLEPITRRQPSRLLPLADTTECRPFARESLRFRRRRAFETSLNPHE